MQSIHPDDFDRVGKALVDSLGVSPEAAIERLQSVELGIMVDAELEHSPTLQAALLTLVNLAPRIFKRPAVIIDKIGVLDVAPLLLSPFATLREAAEDLGAELEATERGTRTIVLGKGDAPGLRVTFDGWGTRVGPTEWSAPLVQRERCSLSGVAGAALALSEAFLAASGLDVEAGKREVEVSLWRPGAALDVNDAGPALEYLPGEAWLLGLGHLGQGIAWALSMLPYPDPSKLDLLLQDYDRVIKANIGTQSLTRTSHVGSRKTSVCSSFLRARGFDPGVVDRPFNPGSPRLESEPALALCGFDAKGPRHILDQVNFERVLVCGVGGTVESFDDIQIHSLPLQERSARELWPPTRTTGNARAVATGNAFYTAYGETHRCGELALAGVSVAVPFVGAMTGSLCWAEVLRELHGGVRLAFQGIPLRCMDERRIREAKDVRPSRYSRPYLTARELLHRPDVVTRPVSPVFLNQQPSSHESSGTPG